MPETGRPTIFAASPDEGRGLARDMRVRRAPEEAPAFSAHQSGW